MTDNKLTDKQERFCKEYVISLNAADAARKAGYSKKTAHVTGVQNLSKASIKKRLEQLQKPKLKQLNLTAEMVLKEMSLVAFSNIQDFFGKDGYLKPIQDLTRDQAAALSSLDIEEMYLGKGEARLSIGQAKKMKMWDKLKALNMLGNHLSLFQDKMDGDEDSDEPDDRFM
nr:terminase small subunit [Nanoarchaeota archaeon]